MSERPGQTAEAQLGLGPHLPSLTTYACVRRTGGLTIDYGAPPRIGWAKLVCELLVSDIRRSTSFWSNVLGFQVAYQRPEQHFVYLERREGAQIMLCQRSGNWETAELEQPYGRGAMFQVFVDSIADTRSNLSAAGWPLYAGPREVWRRYGDREGGQREIVVQDPDGYLLMIAENLDERPLFPTKKWAHSSGNIWRLGGLVALPVRALSPKLRSGPQRCGCEPAVRPTPGLALRRAAPRSMGGR